MIENLSRRHSPFFRTLFGAVALAASPAPSSAAGVAYQAKVICGVDPSGVVARIVPGHYLTTVGIQNPSGDKNVNLKMRVSLTFPPAAAPGAIAGPGPVSEERAATLAAFQAIEVSCDQMVGNGTTSAFFDSLPQTPGGTPAPYFEGFLIVEADRSVTVTVTHTASPDATSPVSTLSVQQLKPRR